MSLEVSVIIRARDKADTIEATFRALRAQSWPVEIVVVDSGSIDGTVEIAQAWADVVLRISPRSFSYGRALNVGAAAASGSVHFALSAHCQPRGATWIEDSLRCYRHDGVVGTGAAVRTPASDPIEDVFLPTLQDALSQPAWGFSNHASSWRADVWHTNRFREDLPACEDKEWSWRVLAAGHRIAFAPRLFVSSAHRRRQGLHDLHRRVAREAAAVVGLGVARPLTGREAVRAWWSSFSADSDRPIAIRRLSPYRLAEVTGAWAGGRAAWCGFDRIAHDTRVQVEQSPSAVASYLPWVPVLRR